MISTIQNSNKQSYYPQQTSNQQKMVFSKIYRLKEAFENSKINNRTWVILDIDETLITSSIPKMFFQEGEDLFQQKLQQENSTSNLKDQYKEDQKTYFQKASSSSLIEKDASQQITTLYNNKKYKIMAVTARFFEGRKATYKTLKNYNIDFSQTAPCKDSIRNKNSNYFFESGILYTNHGTKGMPLISFMECIQQIPKTIIVIDDSPVQLQSIHEHLLIVNQKLPFRDKITLKLFQFTQHHNLIHKQIDAYIKEKRILSYAEALNQALEEEEQKNPNQP